MRMRKKPWAAAELANNPKVLGDHRSRRGGWKEYFGNEHPVFIEIGAGKGRFIIENAAAHQGVNFVGIEKQGSVLASAARRAGKDIPNLAFVRADASGIEEIFAPGEVGRVYINFCDPWPRKKWGKRRLTHRGFLEKYKKLFGGSGELFLKTDNRELFEFSLSELKEAGFTLRNVTFDLYADGLKDNIQTEYEEKFSALGIPICRLEAAWFTPDGPV